MNIKLGDEVCDRITGFTGIVEAITDWRNGCRRITIQPRTLKDGKPVEGHTFDVMDVELVKSDPAPARKTGGPQPEPVRGM